MIFTARRASLALSTGFAGLVLAVSPVAAHAYPGTYAATDQVRLDPTAHVAPDGTVTLTGTYRCSPAHVEPVFLSANVHQEGKSGSVGGGTATCDGAEHTWRNTEQPWFGLVPGTARADASLMELDLSHGVIPRPTVLSTNAHDVVVERG